MKPVVTTGVSTGIGYASASELCQRGYRVFGSVRDKDHAEPLRRKWGPGFTPLFFDVTDADAIMAAAALVKNEIAGKRLYGLVNNAGISMPGPLILQSLDIVREHFEVNVIGVLNTVRAFLPLLCKVKGAVTRPGRIVNISSVSGRIGYPFMGAYAASKHALEGLSDSLRRDFMIYGVDGHRHPARCDRHANLGQGRRHSNGVQGIGYGPVLQGVDLQDTRRHPLPVAAVTRRIVDALEKKRPKTRYVVPDRLIKYWLGPRMLPDRWLD